MIELLLPFAGKILDKFFPDPAQKAEAQVKLMEMAQSGELAKMANDTELFKTEQNNLTSRQQADMASDSWLSKNIRPLTLVAIFTGYFTFGIMDANGVKANESYVQLLGQWGMLVMSFYFGGRTLEKIMEITKGKK
jgi:Holin of 3TMs, for gene-transfer release